MSGALVGEASGVSRQPLVTVVMAVHNNVDFIDEALTSLLRQSWRNLEIIIVLDAPTDGTDRAIAGFEDQRLRVIKNERNVGQTASLKRGFQEAKGDYIARLDGDDIALPGRIEKQVHFLESHPNVGLLGGGGEVIDASGQYLGSLRWPETDLQIRWMSLLANPFGHPTVMLRRDVLDRHGFNYDEAYESAQDYDLWTRIMVSTQVANLAEPLILYRVHGDSVTTKKRVTQLRNHDAIALRTIRQHLPEFAIGPALISDMREFFVGGTGCAKSFPRSHQIELITWYLDLLDGFVEKHRTHSSIATLQREEAVRVARMWWDARFGDGWLRLVKRLFSLSPSFSLAMIKALAGGLWRRIVRLFKGRSRPSRVPQLFGKCE